MAPAVKTFLAENDLKGKNIALVQTHGGWPGHVFSDMKKLCKIKDANTLAVRFDSTGGDKLITEISEIEKGISGLL